MQKVGGKSDILSVEISPMLRNRIQTTHGTASTSKKKEEETRGKLVWMEYNPIVCMIRVGGAGVGEMRFTSGVRLR